MAIDSKIRNPTLLRPLSSASPIFATAVQTSASKAQPNTMLRSHSTSAFGSRPTLRKRGSYSAAAACLRSVLRIADDTDAPPWK